MKRIYCIILVIAVFLILAAGCEKPLVKIGYTGGLTGTNSELGVNGMYGAQMAVEEINGSGGIKGSMLELVVRDDKDNKEVALKMDKELVEEGCIALIGHMTSNMAELSVPYINENKVLMISPTISTTSLSNKDDYFLRLIPANNEQAKKLAIKIKDLGLKDIIIFYTNGNILYAESLSDCLVSQLGGTDIKIEMMESIRINTPDDYKKAAEKISQSEAKGLMIIASADIASSLGQELYQMNNQKTVLLPAWSMTNDLLRRGGAAVEGYYGVSFIDYNSEAKKYNQFKERYLNKYGDLPTFSAVLSYESVMVLAEAMKTSSDYNADTLKKAILKQSAFDGLQSRISIDSFGDTKRDIFLYQINNNKFNKVEN